jgi:hypothetical protein
MKTKSPAWASNSRIAEELQDQRLRVGAFVSAARLWERVLSKRDLQRLDDNLERCYAQLGTVGMWRRLRRVSQARAVADLAHVLGFLDQTNYRWLLRGIGEKPKAEEQRDRPHWQAATGELRWRSRVVRRLRILSRPTNIQIILDAANRQRIVYQKSTVNRQRIVYLEGMQNRHNWRKNCRFSPPRPARAGRSDKCRLPWLLSVPLPKCPEFPGFSPLSVSVASRRGDSGAGPRNGPVSLGMLSEPTQIYTMRCRFQTPKSKRCVVGKK